jgi:hypothetical protein
VQHRVIGSHSIVQDVIRSHMIVEGVIWSHMIVEHDIIHPRRAAHQAHWVGGWKSVCSTESFGGLGYRTVAGMEDQRVSHLST